jgi:hypothetical protein
MMVSQTHFQPIPSAEQAPIERPVAEQKQETPAAEEYGGRPGPDPTRYGDWEKNGRCIDF